jgi:hypothetical protein
LRPITQAVEKNVADAATEDDAEHGVEEEVVDIDRRPGRARLRCASTTEPPRRRKSDEVGDAVPAHLERAKFERDGIEAGVVDHRWDFNG